MVTEAPRSLFFILRFRSEAVGDCSFALHRIGASLAQSSEERSRHIRTLRVVPDPVAEKLSRGLALLFLNALIFRDPQILAAGQEGSLAHTLSEALATGDARLRKLLTPDGEKTSVLEGLLSAVQSSIKSRDTFVVGLNTSELHFERCSVRVGNKRLIERSDLISLAERLENSFEEAQRRVLQIPNGGPAHVSPQLMKLFEEITEKRLRKPMSQVRENYQRLREKRLLVQKEQRVFVEILNPEGDAEIRYNFTVTNVGYASRESRVHQFWFGAAQDEMPITVLDGDGEVLSFETIQSSRNYIEIRVHFSKPILALETLRYSVSFRVRGEFPVTDSQHFYHFTPRTISKHVEFEVVCPEGHMFGCSRVSHESPDGSVHESAPLVVLEPFEKRWRLKWQVKSPPPGDQFRTFWSYKVAEDRVAGIGEVVPLRRPDAC